MIFIYYYHYFYIGMNDINCKKLINIVKNVNILLSKKIK
jgi:hypothetical protein